jgi:virginiamycin B lyase
MRHRFGVSVVVLLVLGLLGPATAGAAPKVADTFAVSGTPGRITEGPDGNVWVLISGSGDGTDVAKVEPDGTVTEYDSDDLSNSVGITSGPDDRIWVTKFQAVASFDPADPTAVDVTPITEVSGQDIVVGPDGDLWTPGDGAVVQIPPGDPGSSTPHPVAGLGGRGIAAGEDGRIWVVDFAGQRLIRMKTDGDFTETAVGGQPQQIAAGPKDQMAYTNPNAGDTVIGLVTAPDDPQEVPMPNTDPFGITYALDGAYWSARFAANDLARVTPQGKLTMLSGFPANSGPRYLTTGEGDTLWVSLEGTLEIAKVTGVSQPKGPKVTITKAPKSTVKTKGKKAKVKFAFKSGTKGAKFKCSLVKQGRGADFDGCKSPETFKLKPGKYEFEVKAKADGVSGKPAKAKFKVKD